MPSLLCKESSQPIRLCKFGTKTPLLKGLKGKTCSAAGSAGLRVGRDLAEGKRSERGGGGWVNAGTGGGSWSWQAALAQVWPHSRREPQGSSHGGQEPKWHLSTHSPKSWRFHAQSNPPLIPQKSLPFLLLCIVSSLCERPTLNEAVRALDQELVRVDL